MLSKDDENLIDETIGRSRRPKKRSEKNNEGRSTDHTTNVRQIRRYHIPRFPVAISSSVTDDDDVDLSHSNNIVAPGSVGERMKVDDFDDQTGVERTRQRILEHFCTHRSSMSSHHEQRTRQRILEHFCTHRSTKESDRWSPATTRTTMMKCVLGITSTLGGWVGGSLRDPEKIKVSNQDKTFVVEYVRMTTCLIVKCLQRTSNTTLSRHTKTGPNQRGTLANGTPPSMIIHSNRTAQSRYPRTRPRPKTVWTDARLL